MGGVYGMCETHALCIPEEDTSEMPVHTLPPCQHGKSNSQKPLRQNRGCVL
jgi:hypothetical protein